MAKWGYLARAYAISEYAYMRATEAENTSEQNDRTEEEADRIDEVRKDIEIIMEMAEDNFITVAETPDEYRTIRKCKRWLKDFA